MNSPTKGNTRLGGRQWVLALAALLAAVSGARVALSSAVSGDTASEARPMAGNVETMFEVTDMTCPMCAITVRTAAKGVRGVVDARVSKEEQRAWVTYDPAQTTPEAIAAAITKAGYPAKPLP